jgi:hypothetical protein
MGKYNYNALEIEVTLEQVVDHWSFDEVAEAYDMSATDVLDTYDFDEVLDAVLGSSGFSFKALIDGIEKRGSLDELREHVTVAAPTELVASIDEDASGLFSTARRPGETQTCAVITKDGTVAYRPLLGRVLRVRCETEADTQEVLRALMRHDLETNK